MSDLHHALVSLEQLDAAILSYADQLEEALAAQQEGTRAEGRSIDLLARITEVLIAKEKDAIDEIVGGLLGLGEMIALAQAKADRFLVQKAKLDDARTKIRLHILNWIDANLPADNRKLQGNLFFLRTQGNGGLPALVVKDETLVPREYFAIRPKLVLPAAVTEEQIETLQAFLEQFIPGARLELDPKRPAPGLPAPELDEAAVRMALSAQLDVPGARLEQGRHLRHSDPKKTKKAPATLPSALAAVETVHTGK